MVKVLFQDGQQIVLEGSTGPFNWTGWYERTDGLCFVLVDETKNTRTTTAAIPHGSACVLPELLGRAILVRKETLMSDDKNFIVAHEMDHILAHRNGLLNNEETADKLAVQLLERNNV